jgi:aryl-alcohol dehydrogenase
MNEGIAAVSRGPGQPVALEKVFVDDPRDNEILVKVASSGICHTDITLANFGVFVPGVYGHEGAGEVIKTGKNVKKVQPGDHVVMCMVYGCGTCSSCLRGHPMNCLNYNMMIPQAREDGSSAMKDEKGEPLKYSPACSFSSFVITEEKAVIKVDKEVSLKMAGILACGVQTVAGTVLNVMKPEVNSSLVVYGCGTLGLSAIMASKISKCYPIIAVDINPLKLKMALKLGATHAINNKDSDPVKEIKENIAPGGVQYAIDTVGHEVVTVQCIQSTCTAGFTVMLGALAMDKVIPIPIMDILGVNRRIQGISEGDVIPDIFIPQLIALYKSGDLPVDKIIKYYPFNEFQKAVDDFEHGKVIKPIVLFE